MAEQRLEKDDSSSKKDEPGVFSGFNEILNEIWGMVGFGQKAAEPKADEKKAAEPKAAEPKAAEPQIVDPKTIEQKAAVARDRHDGNNGEDDDDDDDDDHQHKDDGEKSEGRFIPTGPRPQVERNPNFPDLNFFFGALHGHSVFSDGLCKPAELYKSAKTQMDFMAVTDHSHDSARKGVKPDNPRFEEQKKMPVLSQAPQLYNSTFHEAEQATEPGKFVGLNGVELGTIGKPGQTGMDGVNHINVFEMREFIQTFKEGRKPSRRMQTGHIPEEEQFKKPEVWRIKDGDYRDLVDRLDKVMDATGGRPVIQLNHPRWSQDESPNLDESVRGRDYGQKSFDSLDEWRERFGKYASLLEILSGEALKEVQSGEFKSHHRHTTDFNGYLEKGLHIAPTFGRDSHFCDAGGTPASTGVLATRLDRRSLMDALRERRTFATTSRDTLAAYMHVNDKHIMGSIVDQKDAANVNVTVTVASEVQPDAKYTAILWADQNIGDGELAEKVQTVHISGADLKESAGKVKFDKLVHISGNKAAYYVELQKKDADSTDTDRLWTAPVWVEPRKAR